MVSLRIWDDCKWWDRYFYHCGGWDKVEENLRKEWKAQLVFDPCCPGILQAIRFNSDQHATRFLLKWS